MSYDESSITQEPEPWPQRIRRHLSVLTTVGQDARFLTSWTLLNLRQIWPHVGLGLVALLAFTSSSWSLLINLGNAAGFCTPGGSFNFDGTYDPWASEHIFQITIGFGRLSFTKVKVIDVIWDVVIGRGGQFVLSWITFIVFSKCLNRILEQPHAAVSYDTFRAIIFDRPSLSSTIRLPPDLKRQLGWRARLSLVWFMLASAYVIAFPTIISAMTGYSSNVDPYFDNGNGQKSNLTDIKFNRAIYRINDANRIEGLDINKTFLVGETAFYLPQYTADIDYLYCLQYGGSDSTDTCNMARAVSQYLDNYGMGGPLVINSTFTFPNGTSYPVQSPILDIDVFNTGQNDPRHKQFRLSTGSDADDEAAASAVFMYVINDQTELYTSEELNRRGSCDSSTTYMWGFSFLLLFGFFVATGVWVLGMYAMWSDAFWNSRLDAAGRHMGFYRGVTDISDAMQKDTRQQATKLQSDAEIRDMLASRMNGGQIAYEEIDHDKLPLPRSSDFKIWKSKVPSLCGWTKTWKLLHWFEWCIFTIVGILFFWTPVLYQLTARRRASVAEIALFLIFWPPSIVLMLLAAIMMLTGLGCTIWRWCRALGRLASRSGRKKSVTTLPLSDVASDAVQLVERPRSK